MSGVEYVSKGHEAWNMELRRYKSGGDDTTGFDCDFVVTTGLERHVSRKWWP